MPPRWTPSSSRTPCPRSSSTRRTSPRPASTSAISPPPSCRRPSTEPLAVLAAHAVGAAGLGQALVIDPAGVGEADVGALLANEGLHGIAPLPLGRRLQRRSQDQNRHRHHVDLPRTRTAVRTCIRERTWAQGGARATALRGRLPGGGRSTSSAPQ